MAHNEAERLPACLASVGFCDEIVVVDSGSTDATTEIARRAGARVVDHPWLGFAAQRNVALDHARGDWVLEIDADERVSPQLRSEIEAFLSAPAPGVELAGLPRRNFFLGRALGPAAKYPEYSHRFLRRGAYRHDEERTVHEGLVPHGPVHPFTGDLLHLLATDWSEAVSDAWRYSELEADQMSAGVSFAAFLRGAVLRPAIKFVYRAGVYGGWRDGPLGLAKITLDCAVDTIVWSRHLLGLHEDLRGSSGVVGSQHYGSRDFREGNLRVLGVAAGPRAVAEASDWLIAAGASGADVTLIADCDSRQEELRLRTTRLTPIALIRALDAEHQLRPPDAVVGFGTRAHLLLHGVPRGLRGVMPQITHRSQPAEVATRPRSQKDPR